MLYRAGPESAGNRPFATGGLQLSAIDTGIREMFRESLGQRQKNGETRRKRDASIRRKAEDGGERAVVRGGGEEGAFAHEGERGVFGKKKLHAPCFWMPRWVIPAE